MPRGGRAGQGAGHCCSLLYCGSSGRGARLTCGLQVVEAGQDWPLPRPALLQLVPGITALLCTSADTVDRELLEAAGPQLTLISTMSAGVNHIDLEECKTRDIQVISIYFSLYRIRRVPNQKN